MNGNDPIDRDDWNRWRGEVVAWMESLEAKSMVSERYRESHSRDAKLIEAALYDKINAVEKRLVSLETKVAIFCAAAAAAGGLIGQLLEWALSAPKHV